MQVDGGETGYIYEAGKVYGWRGAKNRKDILASVASYFVERFNFCNHERTVESKVVIE